MKEVFLMAEGNGVNEFRRKDSGGRTYGSKREADNNDLEMIRAVIFNVVMQAITIRDHGPEVEKWAIASAEETTGLLAGLGFLDFQDLVMEVQANPNTFDILAALKNFNKEIPSDA